MSDERRPLSHVIEDARALASSEPGRPASDMRDFLDRCLPLYAALTEHVLLADRILRDGKATPERLGQVVERLTSRLVAAENTRPAKAWTALLPARIRSVLDEVVAALDERDRLAEIHVDLLQESLDDGPGRDGFVPLDEAGRPAEERGRVRMLRAEDYAARPRMAEHLLAEALEGFACRDAGKAYVGRLRENFRADWRDTIGGWAERLDERFAALRRGGAYETGPLAVPSSGSAHREFRDRFVGSAGRLTSEPDVGRDLDRVADAVMSAAAFGAYALDVRRSVVERLASPGAAPRLREAVVRDALPPFATVDCLRAEMTRLAATMGEDADRLAGLAARPSTSKAFALAVRRWTTELLPAAGRLLDALERLRGAGSDDAEAARGAVVVEGGKVAHVAGKDRPGWKTTVGALAEEFGATMATDADAILVRGFVRSVGHLSDLADGLVLLCGSKDVEREDMGAAVVRAAVRGFLGGPAGEPASESGTASEAPAAAEASVAVRPRSEPPASPPVRVEAGTRFPFESDVDVVAAALVAALLPGALPCVGVEADDDAAVRRSRIAAALRGRAEELSREIDRLDPWIEELDPSDEEVTSEMIRSALGRMRDLVGPEKVVAGIAREGTLNGPIDVILNSEAFARIAELDAHALETATCGYEYAEAVVARDERTKSELYRRRLGWLRMRGRLVVGRDFVEVVGTARPGVESRPAPAAPKSPPSPARPSRYRPFIVARTERPLPLGMPFVPLDTVRLVDEVTAAFPHVPGLGLALAKRVSGRRLRPTLLVGPKGSGKSMLARIVMQALDLPYTLLLCSTLPESPVVGGTSKHWSTSQPALPVRLIRDRKVGNPGVILDEIDKVGTGRHNGNLVEALLPFLSPETAMDFDDPSLQKKIDVSRVSWIATANRVEGIDGSLLDRMRVVELPEPGRAHVGEHAWFAYRRLLDREESPSDHEPAFDEFEVEAIRRMWDGRSFRGLDHIVDAVWKARESGRSRH